MSTRRLPQIVLAAVLLAAGACASDGEVTITESRRTRRTTTTATAEAPPSTIETVDPDGPPPVPDPPDFEDEVPPPATLVAYGAQYLLETWSGDGPVGVQIIGVEPDATDAVVAAGAYPPDMGSEWAVVRVRVTNYDTAPLVPDLYPVLLDGDFEDSDYGCPAEDWWVDPTYATLLAGGSIEGTWCFMPTSELGPDAQIVLDDGDSDTVAFALFPDGGGDDQPAPPARPAPSAGEPGSFADPLPAGTPLEEDDWRVAVTSFASSVPAAPGASLPSGWVVVGVGVDASYHGDEPYDSTYVNLGVVDERGVVVWPTTNTGSTAGCEAGPVMTLPVFVPTGYSTGAGKFLCYTVPETAVASLRFTAFFDDLDDPAGFLAVQ